MDRRGFIRKVIGVAGVGVVAPAAVISALRDRSVYAVDTAYIPDNITPMDYIAGCDPYDYSKRGIMVMKARRKGMSGTMFHYQINNL